ncbi:hypothetical protein [uncultured Desulfobacter sp.]|nr:hypothetical protein [uncultured Desulfobacter sp.]
MPGLWCAGVYLDGSRCCKRMGAVKGFCLDYASSCDPLQPATDCVGC